MDLHSPLRHEGRLVVSDRVIAFVTVVSIAGAVIGSSGPLHDGSLFAAFGGAVLGAVVGYFLAVQSYILVTAVWYSPLPRLGLACGVLVLLLGLTKMAFS